MLPIIDAPSSPIIIQDLSVLWLDEVGKGLWLSLVWVGVTVVVAVVVVVVIVVSIILWADVLHLVDRAALWAALDWALAGHLRVVSVWSWYVRHKPRSNSEGRGWKSAYSQPDSDVGVSWETSATSVLLISERSDHDWVGNSS